jgi:hypothetical protein
MFDLKCGVVFDFFLPVVVVVVFVVVAADLNFLTEFLVTEFFASILIYIINMIDYLDLTTILRVRITVVIALIHHPSIRTLFFS